MGWQCLPLGQNSCWLIDFDLSTYRRVWYSLVLFLQWTQPLFLSLSSLMELTIHAPISLSSCFKVAVTLAWFASRKQLTITISMWVNVYFAAPANITRWFKLWPSHRSSKLGFRRFFSGKEKHSNTVWEILCFMLLVKEPMVSFKQKNSILSIRTLDFTWITSKGACVHKACWYFGKLKACTTCAFPVIAQSSLLGRKQVG